MSAFAIRTPRAFALVAASAVAATLLAACGDFSITIGDGESKVKGSGVKATETRAVAAFTAIDATGVGKLKLLSANPDYPDIIPQEGQTIEVWGVVLASVKRFQN